MKTLKKLTLGLLGGCVLTGSASAFTPTATVVHVTGSTAFRTGTVIAIIDTLQGKSVPTGSATTDVYAGYTTSGKNVTSDSNQSIFANGHIDGSAPIATVIVECNWTGSLTGVVDLVSLSSHATNPFLDETNATVQAALSTSGAKIAAGTYANGTQITGTGILKTTQDTIELAQSDSNKTTVAKELFTASLTGSLGSYGTISALATAVGSSLVQDAGTSSYASGAGTVGVVPFQWFLGSSTAATGVVLPTNISQQQAAALFGSGFIPQASFTGTDNGGTDETNTFYLVGRNEDSGTRIGALMESQYGVANATPPTQWVIGDGSSSFSGTQTGIILSNGTTTSTTGIVKWPATTVLNFEPSVYWTTAGHAGYNTGGGVQAALNITSNGTTPAGQIHSGDGNTATAYFLGYLGLTDGNSAIAQATTTTLGAATALTYNGVAYKNANVANGSYTFWTFEHSYTLSTVTGTQRTIVNSIADNLYYRDADAIYTAGSPGSVAYAEPTRNSGVYTESSTAGKSPGNAGLLFDFGFTCSRSATEGGPVTSQY